MTPLEKVALAIRVAGFPKFASAYITACGETAPATWDFAGCAGHLGGKLASQMLAETEVRHGVERASVFDDVKVAAAPADFTAEFHAVNRLAYGLSKVASHNSGAELASRRMSLWNSLKEAAERTPDVMSSLTKMALRVWSETERTGEKTASTRAEREAFALSFAANYLVDQKIASAFQAGEISRDDAVKLAHLSAEAALEDLSGVVKIAVGVGDAYISNGQLHLTEGDTNKRIGHPDKGHTAPWFWDDLPDTHKKKVEFSVEDYDGTRKMWNAGVSIPVAEAKKHPELAKHLKTAEEKTALDPRLIGMGLGAAAGAGIGAASDKDNRWRGAGFGALLGAPTGALGGQIASELMSHGAPDRHAGEVYEKLRVYADKAGGSLPALIEQHKGDILKSVSETKRPIPASLMKDLTPSDMSWLVKLDRAYNGGIFGKVAELSTPGAVAPPPAQSQTPVGVSPPGGGMNADAQRKGMDGFHQLVSYGQAIGNGFLELIQQNKDSIIQHFAEGKKHMPPQLTSQLGPGVIDQVLELKKRMQAPII